MITCNDGEWTYRPHSWGTGITYLRGVVRGGRRGDAGVLPRRGVDGVADRPAVVPAVTGRRRIDVRARRGRGLAMGVFMTALALASGARNGGDLFGRSVGPSTALRANRCW